MRSALLAAVAAIALAVPAAHAQTSIPGTGLTVTTTPSITTDYSYRGISLSRRDPALQTNLDVQHSSGFYIGGFASNVDIAGTDARLETDVMAGYRRSLSGVRLDLGGTYHFFPGYSKPANGHDLGWGEIGLRAATDVGPVTVRGQVQWSPNFRFETGNAVYVDGGVDFRVPTIDVTLSGTVGHTSIEKNVRAGLPDYWNFGVSAAKDVAGFTLAVGYYGTDIDKVDCMNGQSVCGNRVIASVSRKF